MTNVTIDAQTAAKLTSLNGPVQLCDDAGAVLGTFQPGVLATFPPSLKDLSPYSDKELDELAKQTGGRPLSDILRDLEQQ